MASQAEQLATERERLRRQHLDEDPPVCAFVDCDLVIPKPRRYAKGVRYHHDDCRLAAVEYRKSLAKLERFDEDVNWAAVKLYPEEKVRRGTLLAEIKQELSAEELDNWVRSKLSDTSVAKKVGSTQQAVGMARKAHWNDKVRAAVSGAFVPEDRYLKMLGPPDADMRDLLAKDPKKFDRMLDTLVAAFVEWRDEFFRATSDGTYITHDFHRQWIRATLNTIYTGGRQLILSPPRHGKTDLLIHFCVWLIIRDPMIRILWVGPNIDIAKNSLGMVKSILAGHDELREAYLGDIDTWAPASARSQQSVWQSDKFTVNNRPHHRKMPTMWCTGVKGKILSLDADFIVVDDPADPDDSATEDGRYKVDHWFKIKLLSRKMHATGLAMISSRVHPYDLYHQFLDNDNWDVMVNRAHMSDICGKDLFDRHDNDTDCVLFPELNPLDYLRLQADDVGPDLFDMMYQNQPRPDDTMIFDPEKIRDRCLDRSRGLGLLGIPEPYRLVAGLDPAARGVQAAFLWAVRLPSFAPDFSPGDPRHQHIEETYYMVDLETQSAGGMDGALKVMKDWFVEYGVDVWVVEDTSFQKVFMDDPRIKELQTTEGLSLTIKGHDTGKSKHDKDFGVTKTADLYHNGHVVLPYGTPEAQRKTNKLITQLTNFTGDRPKKAGKSDILMASWFPFAEVIRKWKRDERVERIRQNEPVSYPGYVSSQMTAVPWTPTIYPNMGN